MIRTRLVAACGAVALLAGCSTATTEPAPAPDPTTLTVSAASSLTEAFTEIADDFMAGHPGIAVTLNFAGSSALVEQVIAGAPVDVLAVASTATMATVVEAGLVSDPTPFATNSLAVITPARNEADVTSLADLADPAVSVALCSADVPCGAAALELLGRNGLEVTPVTLDPDVKSVLGRVVADEVDAGIVYVTDARAAGADVTSIPIPPGANTSTDYLAAVVSDSARPDLAAEFIELLTGPTGLRMLADRGFGPP